MNTRVGRRPQAIPTIAAGVEALVPQHPALRGLGLPITREWAPLSGLSLESGGLMGWGDLWDTSCCSWPSGSGILRVHSALPGSKSQGPVYSPEGPPPYNAIVPGGCRVRDGVQGPFGLRPSPPQGQEAWQAATGTWIHWEAGWSGDIHQRAQEGL